MKFFQVFTIKAPILFPDPKGNYVWRTIQKRIPHVKSVWKENTQRNHCWLAKIQTPPTMDHIQGPKSFLSIEFDKALQNNT